MQVVKLSFIIILILFGYFMISNYNPNNKQVCLSQGKMPVYNETGKIVKCK